MTLLDSAAMSPRLVTIPPSKSISVPTTSKVRYLNWARSIVLILVCGVLCGGPSVRLGSGENFRIAGTPRHKIANRSGRRHIGAAAQAAVCRCPVSWHGLADVRVGQRSEEHTSE